MPSHYSASESSYQRYLCDPKLSGVKLWAVTCKRLSPAFYAQASKMNFWDTYDNRHKRTPPGHREERQGEEAGKRVRLGRGEWCGERGCKGLVDG